MGEQTEVIPWHCSITRSGGETSHTVTVVVRGSRVYLFDGDLTDEELANWVIRSKGPTGFTEEELLNWKTRLAEEPRPFTSIILRETETQGEAKVEAAIRAIKPLLTGSFRETVRVSLPPRSDFIGEFEIEATVLGYAVHFPFGPDFSVRNATEQGPVPLSDLKTLPRDFEIVQGNSLFRVLGVTSRAKPLEVIPIVCQPTTSGELELHISAKWVGLPIIRATEWRSLKLATWPPGELDDWLYEESLTCLIFLSDTLVAIGDGSFETEELHNSVGLWNVEIFEGHATEVVAKFLEEHFPIWVLVEGIRLPSKTLSWDWDEAKLLHSLVKELKSCYPPDLWMYTFRDDEDLFPPGIIDRALEHLRNNSPDLEALNKLLSNQGYGWSKDLRDKLMTIAWTYTNLKLEDEDEGMRMVADCLDELLSLAGRRPG